MSGSSVSQRTDFPAIEELMPHRGPALLLDRVLSHDHERTEAAVMVETQQWLKRDDGTVAGWLAVEYMAQCLAAHEGILALDEGRPPPKGFLIAATGLRLYQTHFPGNARLRVGSRRVRGRPGLGILSHQCTLHAEPSEAGAGTLLAEGRLSVSIPKKWPA